MPGLCGHCGMVTHNTRSPSSRHAAPAHVTRSPGARLMSHSPNSRHTAPAHVTQPQLTSRSAGSRHAAPAHVQFSSVAQSCPTLCNHMNRSTPGLPVHHQLPEFTQTHMHTVGDAIQPSHPLSSPSPPAPNPSQHQGLFPMSQLFT